MIENALVKTLNLLAGTLSGAGTPGGVLVGLAEYARGLLPFSAVAVALMTPEGWNVWRLSTTGTMTVSDNGAVPHAAIETLERFLDHGEALHINNLLEPPWSTSTHRDVLWKEGVRSALLLPLVAGSRRVGVLSFTSTKIDQYPPEKLQIATLLAWMTAATLNRFPDGFAEQESQ
jgi:transcriptional regulator with GAF, ATPase, and Fis domain